MYSQRTRVPLFDRMVAKIEFTETCWLWRGALGHDGYGLLNSGGRGTMLRVHRLTYEMFVETIPEGLQIDHLCRIRNCVRPEHLEAVTPEENRRRESLQPLPLECGKGHLYDEANTYLLQGRRYCRMCRRVKNTRRPTGQKKAADR